MRKQSIIWMALALTVVTATSCNTGSQPPRAGTPAFNWQGAQEAWRNGDFVKADSSLQELIRIESDFSARARPWQIVIAAGLVQGYSETADTYDRGARLNRENPMPFHKQATALRSQASTTAVELIEGLHIFMEKQMDPEVRLAFAYPAGTAAQPAALKKVATGMILQESEREGMQLDMLQRGVLLSLCRAAGNPDDTAKTLDKFKTGDVTVPRDVFLFNVAKMMQEQAELFAPNKLDHPGRLKAMVTEALEALHTLPETKETKAVAAKLQGLLKKGKAT
jgi:hypothetical protein